MSAREVDNNGFIEIKDNPISKAGVFSYSGAMLGGKFDAEKMYNVYRPEGELGSDECINSFKLMPWIDEHVMLGANATPAEKKGIQGVIGEDVYFKDGILYANLKVFSESMANLIDNGKKELSCGYRSEIVPKVGTWNGKTYDAIQTRIRGNHIALVAEGRMGADVAVLDSKFIFDFKEQDMTTETTAPAVGPAKTAEPEKKVVKDGEITLESLAASVEALTKAVEALTKTESEAPAAALTKTESEEPVADADPAVAKDEAAETMDAAEITKHIYKDIAARDALYASASKIIGVFDHAGMSHAELTAYAAKKLDVQPQDVNGYLAGLAVKPAAMMDAQTTIKSTSVDEYLKGGK